MVIDSSEDEETLPSDQKPKIESVDVQMNPAGMEQFTKKLEKASNPVMEKRVRKVQKLVTKIDDEGFIQTVKEMVDEEYEVEITGTKEESNLVKQESKKTEGAPKGQGLLNSYFGRQ